MSYENQINLIKFKLNQLLEGITGNLIMHIYKTNI